MLWVGRSTRASSLVHLPSGLTENVFLTSLSAHLAALVWEKTHAEAYTIPMDLMQILKKNFRIWLSVGFFFLKAILCDPLRCAVTSSGKASLMNRYHL